MLKKTIKRLLNPSEISFPFILWAFLSAVSTSFFSNIVSDIFGNFYSLFISGFLMLLLVFLLITLETVKERKLKKSLSSSINSRKLTGDYKGLMAFVSENKLKDDKKREYVENVIKGIKDYKRTNDVSEIAKISGIGHTFRALDYHLKTGKLRYCWLIYSDQSGINVDLIKSFFEIVKGNAIKPEFVKINDPNNSKNIKKIIDNLYENLPDDLKETDVIADITAGNKPMTAAMVLSCLNPDRNLEYIEQSEKKELIEVNISPKFKGVEL
ncbi:MAG: hypothetical protein ACPK85_11470 [Methanosarcina sp.]